MSIWGEKDEWESAFFWHEKVEKWEEEAGFATIEGIDKS